MTKDSQTSIEVTVSIKGDDQSFKKKFLIYEEATMSHEDPVIAGLIEDAKKECKFGIDEIVVKASF